MKRPSKQTRSDLSIIVGFLAELGFLLTAFWNAWQGDAGMAVVFIVLYAVMRLEHSFRHLIAAVEKNDPNRAASYATRRVS